MTIREQYSETESLNRLLKTLKGSAPTEDAPGTLTGEILASNIVWSDIAEIFAGSLPGEQLYFPDYMRMRYGQIYMSTATGTSQAFASGTWEAVEGFQAAVGSCSYITGDYANNRLFVTKSGTYLANFGVTYDAVTGTANVIEWQLTVEGTQQANMATRNTLLYTTDCILYAGAEGFVTIDAGTTGVSVEVDARLLTEDRTLHTYEAQLNLVKISN